MTLSSRARAFSVDNLLKPSPQNKGTTAAAPASASASPSPPVDATRPPPATLSSTSQKIVAAEDDHLTQHVKLSTGITFPDEIQEKTPSNHDDFTTIYVHRSKENLFNNKQLYFYGSSASLHKFNNVSLDEDFVTESVLERKLQTKSENDHKSGFLQNECKQYASEQPEGIAVQDINACRFAFVPCTGSSPNVEKMRHSPALPTNTKYMTHCSSSVLTSSCFCHGELTFCHHPGIISLGDNHRPPVIVELCHADLWASFHRLGTEMIITKSGRRMFPALKLRVSGLDPDKLYTVTLEFLQPDTRKYRYIYHSSRWMVSGSGDTISKPPSHRTPDGPTSGQVICSQIVSFERLKLTNTESSKHGQVSSMVSLVSMQKFQPQVVIEEVKLRTETDNSPLEKYVILFPQTSFMAVTAYQNQQITTLKIASNPFAKGFRDSGKTRIPCESFANPFPNLMLCNGQLDYLPGLRTPPSWSSVLQRENLNWVNAKRRYEGLCDSTPSKPSKTVKLEEENCQSVIEHLKQPDHLERSPFYTSLHPSFVTPHQLHQTLTQNQNHQNLQQQQQQQQETQRLQQQFDGAIISHILQPQALYHAGVPLTPAPPRAASNAAVAVKHQLAPSAPCDDAQPSYLQLPYQTLPLPLSLPKPTQPSATPSSVTRSQSPIDSRNSGTRYQGPFRRHPHAQKSSPSERGSNLPNILFSLEEQSQVCMNSNTNFGRDLPYFNPALPSRFACIKYPCIDNGQAGKRPEEHRLQAVSSSSHPIHVHSHSCLSTGTRSSETSPTSARTLPPPRCMTEPATVVKSERLHCQDYD